MRGPFILAKDAFSEETLFRLYDEFADEANFDFHLMISFPDSVIKTIDEMIPADKREDTNITIHREAYRDSLGPYNSKDYDLFEISTGNPSLDGQLRTANMESGESVYRTLKDIKESGYKAGLALEPGTSLKNVSAEMVRALDMILLMSVSSGAGGQGYRHEVTGKIREARRKYGKLMIQVDGGINEETLPMVIESGAGNIVIGSYITGAEDPTDPVNQMRSYLKQHIPPI